MNQWPLVSFSVVVTVEITRFYKNLPVVLDSTVTVIKLKYTNVLQSSEKNQILFDKLLTTMSSQERAYIQGVLA